MCKEHCGEGKKPFYITAPIYYPSANLHLGNTYTSIVCDTVRRYMDELGYDTYYVTGSDEHGEKLARAAADKGKEPKEYIDPIVQSIKDLWKLLDVEPDTFVRSTDPQHEKDVQKIVQQLYNQGDIYKDVYKGYYCTPCEEFWTESQLVDGKCPSCGRPVEYREEESYFFRLSKYQDRLLKYYEDHPDFIKPLNRKKEMIGSFFKDGLEDLSVSRHKIDWGVKIPFDPDHVVYVWIDALICYLTGIGYGDDPEKFKHYWPAGIHFVGRDIVRFHTIIWPAVLMALNLPLPDQVFGHGWILFDDDKMSKSKGNVIYPEPLVELYGRDVLKYFVLREFNFGTDGNFSSKKFLQRLNSDLANDLGNLVSRTIAMIEKYREGLVPQAGETQGPDEDLLKIQRECLDHVKKEMKDYTFQHVLEEIWTLIRRTNKYIDETAPWILAKEDGKRLDTVLYRLADSLRAIACLLRPFMPETSEEIFRRLGMEAQPMTRASEANVYPAGTKVVNGKPLFPRLDLEKELGHLYEANDKLIAERLGISLEDLRQRRTGEKKKAGDREKPEKTQESEKKPADATIAFEDFEKVRLRVGEVIDCKPHPDADRLLVETVDFGDETRTIVSGIRDWYQPRDLIGKKLVFCVNLKPRKIRGIESYGMILTAEDEEHGTVAPLSPIDSVEKGTYIG